MHNFVESLKLHKLSNHPLILVIFKKIFIYSFIFFLGKQGESWNNEV